MDAFSANSDASDTSLLLLVHEILGGLAFGLVESVMGEIVKKIGTC